MTSITRFGFAITFSLAVVVSTASDSAAAAVLDQDNAGPSSGAGAVANDRTQSQTLTVGTTGMLTQVNVLIYKNSNTFEDITLSVRSTTGGVPDALLTSASLPASAIGTANTLAAFDVSAAGLSFNAGDVIAIELTSLADNVAPFDERYAWRWYNDDPYAGGQRFTSGVASSNFDFAFQTFVEPAPLLGDLDSDGFVGITDLNTVLSNWNANVSAGDLLAGDPSGDGFVGIEDLNVVLGNWNAGTPPSDAASIPEPGVGLLLVLGLGGWIGRAGFGRG